MVRIREIIPKWPYLSLFQVSVLLSFAQIHYYLDGSIPMGPVESLGNCRGDLLKVTISPHAAMID